jgi:undecaprenyl-diphosphatase
MEVWEGILLGILQGLTEFLPVSSSGHLVIAGHFFGLSEGGITFGVLVHLATLIAVFIVFWDDIIDIFKGLYSILLSLLRLKDEKISTLLRHDSQVKLVALLLIGSIPAGIAGLLFKDFFEELFKSPVVTGFMLLVTGGILWLASRLSNRLKIVEDMTSGDALLIGVAQAVAIFPGISRSGSTITGGLLRGLNRENAARFSFLLSIPVIGGAALLESRELIRAITSPEEVSALVAGFIAALISGYIAIKFLLSILKKGRLHFFSYYCWALGILTILFAR